MFGFSLKKAPLGEGGGGLGRGGGGIVKPWICIIEINELCLGSKGLTKDKKYIKIKKEGLASFLAMREIRHLKDISLHNQS